MHPRFFSRLAAEAGRHRFLALISAALLIAAVIAILSSLGSKSSAVSYKVAQARMGDIIQTVSASGQVKALQETDLKSSVPGTVSYLPVSAGQHVTEGQLIASLDSSSAQLDLKSAQINYQKDASLPQPEDSSAAESDLSKAQSDAYAAASAAISHLPDIFSGMKQILHSQSGYLSGVTTVNLDQTSRKDIMEAADAFDAAYYGFNDFTAQYGGIATSSITSATSSQLENYVSGAEQQAKTLARALQLAHDAANFIYTNNPGFNPNGYAAVQEQLPQWISAVADDLSKISTARNTLSTASSSLSKVSSGAGPYGLATDQNEIAQKRKILSNYFIRAPYDGIIGRVAVGEHDQITSGDTLATIFTENKQIVTSLDQVDAATIQSGQPVTITFDAVDGLTATGTVTGVDGSGTVSQGVVSYGARASITGPDYRIKPGMTANISITTFRKPNVVIVPTSAIRHAKGTSYVLTLDTLQPNIISGSTTAPMTDRPTMRNVILGSSDDTNTEIISGLSLGEYVVIGTSTNSH